LFSHFLRSKFEHRLEQIKLGIADSELSSVNSDCDAARAGSKVVTREPALPSFIEATVLIKR
jgi:hypothetical protein